MNEPVFDHEKLDVYRLSIDYVAFSYAIASRLTGNNRHARDRWLRAAQSIPLNIAEGNGKHSLKDRSRFFNIARGSALECAAIHDILTVCHAIDPDDKLTGKSQLLRFVAMLTKLVARNESVSENPTVCQTAFEQEQEHEHEVGVQGLEEQHRQSGEQSNLTVGLLGRSLRDRDAIELGIVHIEDKRERANQVNRGRLSLSNHGGGTK